MTGQSSDRGADYGWLAPLLAAFGLMFSVWAVSPYAFGKAEPWDTPYPFYSTATLLGGVILGLLFPHRVPSCVFGAWAGQVVALLFLPGHDRGWFMLGLITTGIGSTFVAGAAAVGGWLRELLGRLTRR